MRLGNTNLLVLSSFTFPTTGELKTKMYLTTNFSLEIFQNQKRKNYCHGGDDIFESDVIAKLII